MGRKRQYVNSAERLKAFRARTGKQSVEPDTVPVSPPAKSRRKPSRQARLSDLKNDAQALLDEFQAWRENQPESLQASRTATKLDEAVDRLTDIVETLDAIELPKGYGRD